MIKGKNSSYTLNGINFRNPAHTLRQAQSDPCASHTELVEVSGLAILKYNNAEIYPVHSIILLKIVHKIK